MDQSDLAEHGDRAPDGSGTAGGVGGERRMAGSSLPSDPRRRISASATSCAQALSLPASRCILARYRTLAVSSLVSAWRGPSPNRLLRRQHGADIRNGSSCWTRSAGLTRGTQLPMASKGACQTGLSWGRLRLPDRQFPGLGRMRGPPPVAGFVVQCWAAIFPSR
jgi:hypothetical protein